MIVATTGHAEPEYMRKAWIHEMDEIVIKPVSTDNIIAILDDMIDFQYQDWNIINYDLLLWLN